MPDFDIRQFSIKRLRRRRIARGDGMTSAVAVAAKVEDRLLAMMASQLLFQQIASSSVVVMTLLVSGSLENSRAIGLIAMLQMVTIGHNAICAAQLRHQLRVGSYDLWTRRRMNIGLGFAAFFWGALTWPLVVGGNLDFMTFMIVIIVLFSLCLGILSASFHRPAMIAVATAGSLSLGAKIAVLTPVIGPLLPLGFAIFITTTAAYALVIEREAHGGVLVHMRSEQASEKLARANDALAEALANSKSLADRDALTDLRNRRAFMSELEAFFSRFGHRPLCLMLLDIDHFKSINDRFGHETGDGVLISVGTALRQWEQEGTGRLTGRWGGEEFIALIALRKGEHPSSAAEDLRLRIEALGEQLHWPEPVKLTTSIGCARLWSPAQFDKVLTQADAALYLAKGSGRNCWKLAA